ncbi:MAG: tripartite tricarboxylate transporter substrate-binding protein, partial [Burkholderiales bacterium]
MAQRRFSSTTVIAGLALLSGAALAQPTSSGHSYPVRPIRVIVANTAGSATDGVTRMVAQRFTEAWGQQMVVDNRAGAGGIIGHDLAAKAAPDGYTLLVSTSAGLVIQPLLTKVPYDSRRDFAPISMVVLSPQMLVSHPAVPANNVAELVSLARAKPGQLNCASPGTGTSNH